LPSIHISGCNNSCARHQVNAMGFAGSKKRIGDEVCDVFELHVGGCFSKDKTEFGKKLGYLKKEDIPSFIVELASELERRKMDFVEYISESFEEFELLVKPYIHD
jgi:sulfite reductase beta subunit-like hemoprotein